MPASALAATPAALSGPALDPAANALVKARRRRLGQPRLLLVGCGDVGLRIVARLQHRFRIFGTVTSTVRAAQVRAAGAIPLLLDLDAAAGAGRDAARIAGLATRVMLLAPTSASGRRDRRARRLLSLLARREPMPAGARLIYVSTTGVYGDRKGAWIDETTTPAPGNDRSARRLDAENILRACRWHARVVRAPGIYAADRLPVDRLRTAIPVPLPAEDVYTNHIHAEDLARACIAALLRGAPARVYNAVDDTELLLGQYLDRVADHARLPRPPRAPWEDMRRAAGPQRMAFLSESRRIRNRRLKRELRLRLRYPDVDAGLAGAAREAGSRGHQASNRPSTDR